MILSSAHHAKRPITLKLFHVGFARCRVLLSSLRTTHPIGRPVLNITVPAPDVAKLDIQIDLSLLS